MFGTFKKSGCDKKDEMHDETCDSSVCKKENNEQSLMESNETNDRIAELEKELLKSQEEIAQVREQFLRLGADLHNYKKRVEKDRLTWMQSTQAAIFYDMITVVNDFDRALDQAKMHETNQDLAQWLSGFILIRKSLADFLKRNNVEPIAQVSTFDPELHEALMHVEAEGKVSGDIVAVLEPGYMLNGVVLKPAKVSVAR